MKEISDLLTKLTNKIHSLESRVSKYLVVSFNFAAFPDHIDALNVQMLQQIIDNCNFQRNVSDLLGLPPSRFAATGRYSSQGLLSDIFRKVIEHISNPLKPITNPHFHTFLQAYFA